MNESELKKKIQELEKALEKESKEKARIQKEYEKTKEEFEKYKSKYPAIKELPHFVKEDIKTEKKKPGQKVGHKGYARKIPERIDLVVPLEIKACPDCNNKLNRTQEIRKRTITDIPLTSKITTTQYEIHRKYCSYCDKIVESTIPDTISNSPFGINLMLFIVFLKIGMALPYNKIRTLLMTMYDLKISEGCLVNILLLVKEEFGDYYKILEKKMKKVRVKNADESSWRIDGINHYIWIFITKEIALYKIRKSRGSEVAIEVLGKQKNKTITCDGFSAYSKLKKLVECFIQLCWFHILKNSRKYKKVYPDEGELLHKKLKGIFTLAKSYNHQATDDQVENLKKEIKWLAHPIYKHKEIKGFVKTLQDRIDELFRFTQDVEVEGNNNLAERGIRKAVIIRKISNGSRSHNGAGILEVLLSVVETAKLQGQNPLLFMKEKIASKR